MLLSLLLKTGQSYSGIGQAGFRDKKRESVGKEEDGVTSQIQRKQEMKMLCLKMVSPHGRV